MKRIVVILMFMLGASSIVVAQKRVTSVELYPVPLRENVLKIRLQASTAMTANTLELRNFIGKKLQEIRCEGKTQLEFSDMRQYPEGVYVILIKTKNGKIAAAAKFTISK